MYFRFDLLSVLYKGALPWGRRSVNRSVYQSRSYNCKTLTDPTIKLQVYSIIISSPQKQRNSNLLRINKTTHTSPTRNRLPFHCAQLHRELRSETARLTPRSPPLATRQQLESTRTPLFATLASLPGLPEHILGEAVLDRFSKTSVSPHDPTTTRRTSYTLIANNCTHGERRLTYLIELTEVGPNVHPCFPVIATATTATSTTSSQPTDLRVTTASSVSRRTLPVTFANLAPRLSTNIRQSKE